MMAVVNIRGDRLYHEHISWDQGTVLRQIGALPEKLSLTVDPHGGKTNGHTNGNGTAGQAKYEVIVPVAGSDTAAKMREKNSVESNQMFEYKAKEI